MDIVDFILVLVVAIVMAVLGISVGETTTEQKWACYNSYQSATTMVDSLRIQIDYDCPEAGSIILPDLTK